MYRSDLSPAEAAVSPLAARPGPTGNGRALKVAVIGHIRHPVAEPYMGGMEAHCASLCEGLVAAGHEPTLFAAPDADVSCGSVAICDRPYEEVFPWAAWRGSAELDAYQSDAFGRAWREIEDGDFDVVHNNSLFPPLIGWAAAARVPMLTSQHVPPFGTMHDAVCNVADVAHARFTVTSFAQVPLWFDDAPANLTAVYNGIDCRAFSPGAKHGRLVWTGRITPNKGTALAARAAQIAGVALDIAGSIEDEDYFAREVAPHIGGKVRFLGHMKGDALRSLVAGASAVVATPTWEEPFGLVVAEALACDVAVIAFDRGAMSEVIGDCGVIVPAEDVNALAEAMASPPSLATGQARRRALSLFSNDRMIEGYVAQYRLAMAAAREAEEAAA